MLGQGNITSPTEQKQTLRLSKRAVKFVGTSRALNFLMAVAIAAALMPLMVCLVCFARVVVGPQFMSRHQRLGLHGQTFQLLNFRSIPIDSAKCSSRAIMFCHFLESTGLAALPQIFNVIKGDMNLIGPHPTSTRLARTSPLEKPGMFQQSQTA